GGILAGGDRAARGARNPARAGVRPPRRPGPHALKDVAQAGGIRRPPARSRPLMLTAAALLVGGAMLALGAALWAGLLALGEEVAVGEALHTLGDAPPPAAGACVPWHRALHVARLALLVLGAVAAGHALGWWQRPWGEALADLALAIALLFVVGDALPRALVRLAPEVGEAALPIARRTLAPFRPLLWL